MFVQFVCILYENYTVNLVSIFISKVTIQFKIKFGGR